MPVDFASKVITDGVSSVRFLPEILQLAPWAALIYALRWFFGGQANKVDRVMHGKVVMVSGGTSGLGAAIVDDLASRGAQIILLVRSTHDSWLVDHISDLRARHSNALIYAEECDFSSLHGIRLFCTKWLDNSPPRRLDSIVLAAGVMAPPFAARTLTQDGVEAHWGIDYLGPYHFLTLMMPSLKAQPPDRDVRVLVATCAAYMMGDLDLNDAEFLERGYPARRPWLAYGAAKIAVMALVAELQRQLDAYKRPDGMPTNVKIYSVDPGIMRSPGSRRWLSLGSVVGLLAYIVMWPLWWLVLKSTWEGAQSFLAALYDPEFSRMPGGGLIRECRISPFRKLEIESEILGQQLCELSKAQVQQLEKQAALVRAREKKKKEAEKEKDMGSEQAASSNTGGNDTSKSSSKKRSDGKKVSFIDSENLGTSATEAPKSASKRKTKKT
ncbi:hypothetical protein DRE_00828 [Drechslerella stenobrocha 248]|uniref:Ketoreductase (KR) domain-containing protein n=1 Tax=Drechslerella stenobrocha 248 TaxID=1043628 RepID=W7HQI8_9PEZI|nr:hypothetical protein DRE_00828 [Drechslerella stenobrocha 248]